MPTMLMNSIHLCLITVKQQGRNDSTFKLCKRKSRYPKIDIGRMSIQSQLAVNILTFVLLGARKHGTSNEFAYHQPRKHDTLSECCTSGR